MMRSMFAGVSGLRSHQVMMDVVGNNIANVNTIGFKASRVEFQDTLSQLIRGASGGTGEATAGVNPQQVGLGVKVGGIDLIFSQGASQLTGKSTDVAIQGDGFFVMRMGAETLYTRAGAFNFDQDGFLTDPSGAIVQGWLTDPVSGQIMTNAPVGDIKLPVGQVIAPQATKSVTIGGNLSANLDPTDPATWSPVKTAISIIDKQGTAQRVEYTFTPKTNAGALVPNVWTMTVAGPGGAMSTSGGAASIDLTFDVNGGLVSTTEGATVTAYDPPVSTLPSFVFTGNAGAADDVQFDVNFGAPDSAATLSQYGGGSTAAAISQDGSTTGYLRSFAISDDGVVSGVFSNGRSQPLGRVALGSFNNPPGLVKAGGSMYRATGSSGQALVGTPGTAGRGSMAAGTLEMSNVDLAQEFTNLIIAQRGFQANSRIITASDELLQDLVNLKR
jgi:flagellar hook protein FlgE